MTRTVKRGISALLCLCLLLTTAPLPVRVSSGTVQSTLGIENDVPGTVVDNTFGIGSGMGGDTLIEVGTKGLESTPNSLTHGASYIGGGILKWGGYYIGVYDTTQDTVKIFTETSKHNTTTGVFVDKSLAVVSAGMGWAAILGGAIAIFTVTATAPATGTLAVVTGTTWAIGTAAVGFTRAVVNSATGRNIEDLVSGKKKLVFAPFERPNIKEGRNIIMEELGFDPYDRSYNEIPDPSTGIPVYKPNIYIYSGEDREVNVKLSQPERITESIPAYDPKAGWTARIFDGSINGVNDYLFYEAIVPDRGFQKSEGWRIRKESLEQDLARILDIYGFNDKEKADFLEYWCDMLDDENGYAMYPQDTAVVDKILPATFTPSPENLFRLWFYFSPLADGYDIPAPAHVERIVRGEYTAVEWGGLVGPDELTSILPRT